MSPLILLLASALAGSNAQSCPATAVHLDQLPQAGDLSDLRWVQAQPLRAGIVGMLFAWDPALQNDPTRPTFALHARGRGPNGASAKVLWIIRNSRVSGTLTIRGSELGGSATFRQQFQVVYDASAHPAKGFEYASIVNVPFAGCWRLSVQSGRASGSLVVRVVEP